MSGPVPVDLFLDPSQFGDVERTILRTPAYEVSAFRYPSGVEAARIRCGRGEFVWLPWLGQQIWDWSVDGRSLKFTGFVAEPAWGRTFLENYGGFLVHCGITAMGNPGPGDAHPQHGELPLIRMDGAWIRHASGGDGESLALCGTVSRRVPFRCDWECVFETALHPSGESAEVELRLRNAARTPLDYMYLGHLNFTGEGAARMETTAGTATGNVRVRAAAAAMAAPGRGDDAVAGAGAAAGIGATDKAADKAADVAADVAARPRLDPEIVKMPADPEFVATLGDSVPADGETVSRLLREDGSSFRVRHGGAPLDHQVVWISRSPDRSACGFDLPATAGPDGFAAEKALGNVKVLAPGAEVTMRYGFGYSRGAPAS